jgi:hypothetical protein
MYYDSMICEADRHRLSPISIADARSRVRDALGAFVIQASPATSVRAALLLPKFVAGD